MWDFFDKIYVVSIPSSKRKKELALNFQRVGIKNYEIIDFVPSSKVINDGGEKDLSVLDIFCHNFCDSTCENITKNHLSLIQFANKLNLNNILIFEDDAVFETPIDNAKLNRVKEWLSTNEWDMFYFGFCLYPIPLVLPTNSTDVVKLCTPYLAHSYALNRSAIKYISNNIHLFRGKHIDGVYANLDLKKYGIWKSVCFQSSDPALFKRAMDKIGMDFDLKGISKFLENVSIAVPTIIIFVLLFLMYKFYGKKLLM